MAQLLRTLAFGRSTCFTCLLLSSPLVSFHSPAVNPPPVMQQQVAQLPDARTIAEQVRQEAIAQEKLDTSAKVMRIERVGRGELWMYNPVPYWKITIADRQQQLVYFTTDNGRFRALMQRNGQKVHPFGPPAREIPPPEMVSTALRQAKEWGYPGRPLFPNVATEKTTWASGCETVSAPFPCDPVARHGWKLTIPHQRARWVFRGETAESLQLIERSNPAIERLLPPEARNEIKRVAGNHFQLLPAVAMITRVEPQTFSDSCLGLGDLAESCARQTMRGYRVTVAGTPKEQQVYRISANALILRTEANAGLPSRTDELPTTIARKVLNAARSDLQQTPVNLRITQTQPTYPCPPNAPCLPTQKANGWKVTVTNFQKSVTYTVNLDGAILGKQ